MKNILYAAVFSGLCVLLRGVLAIADAPSSLASSSPAPSSMEFAAQALERLGKEIAFHRLSNGMRVLMYRRGSAPVFAGAVMVRVGGSDEELGHTGISHMFEHMAFKGTPDIGVTDAQREAQLLAEIEAMIARGSPPGQVAAADRGRWDEIQEELKALWVPEHFSREYEKRGATGLNATTDTELTRYFVSLPRAAFEYWAFVESERLLRPVMRQFYQERDVVMEERRMRFDNDPGGRLYELLLGVAFRAHPYRNPVIGYPFDIAALTATETDQFRRRFYVPENMVVSIVGDVDAASDLQVLERYFGRLPRGELPSRPTAVEAPQEGQRIVTLEAEASPQVMIVYPKPSYPNPDDPKITLLLDVLAGGQVSPLYRELVQKRRLVSGVSTFEGPGNSYPNLAYFMLQTKPPHTNDEVIRAFDEVMEQEKRKGISEEQLLIAKRSLAVDTLSQFNSNLSVALLFGGAEATFGDWRIALRWFDEAMAATPSDLLQVFNDYFETPRRTIGRLETRAQVSGRTATGGGRS